MKKLCFDKKFYLCITAVILLGVSALSMNYVYRYNVQRKTIKVYEAKPSQREVIARIIKDRLSEIEDCYNTRLEEGLEGEGAIQIGWFLDGSGRVSAIEEMRNDLADANLYDCSSEAISQWTFPKDLILKVHYTFHLRQKRQPASRDFGFDSSSDNSPERSAESGKSFSDDISHESPHDLPDEL